MPNNDKNEQQSDFLSSFVDNNPDSNKSILSAFDEKKRERQNEDFTENENTQSTSGGYVDIDMSTLPMKDFYKRGTVIKIKKADVEDVQNYSAMIDKNYLDVTEKMNKLLSSCVRLIHPNGQISNYKDIRDGDRFYLVFKIRELTFPNDPFFKKIVTCKTCDKPFEAYFRSYTRKDEVRTFVNHEFNKKLMKYYNSDLKIFELKIQGTTYRIAPPVIGLSEIFMENVKEKLKNEEVPNVSFLKIIPFTLWDRNKISKEGIIAKEKEFKNMDMETFQIINKFIDKLKFGLKGIENECPHCKENNLNDTTFKGGASSLFVMNYDEFDDLFED